MNIKSDKWIKEMANNHRMIEPFESGQVRLGKKEEKLISYGTSSYGYDVRCSNEFKVFTNINSATVDPKSFDENANYSFGIKEHVIFPEVNFDKVEKVRGMDITVVTSTNNKLQAKALLDKFNFPFVKKGAN